MNEYYDRYGNPLQRRDAVAALRGSEKEGYKAYLYIVDVPSGHHTLMLRTYYPYVANAEVYQYIPTDKEELERRRLTLIGHPSNNTDLETFERWRHEVSQLPNTDSEQVQRLRFTTNARRHF